MVTSKEISNRDLKIYKEEFDKLQTEERRIQLQKEAILTTAAMKLEKQFNLNRLDFAHLSKAYSVFTQNDLESLQFKIVDTTIRDLFLTYEADFEFVTINPAMEVGYEYLYRYQDKTIAIKIPSAPYVTMENIDKLDWGVFSVYEVLKTYNTGTELALIVKSDDTNLIKTKISEYLQLNKVVESSEIE